MSYNFNERIEKIFTENGLGEYLCDATVEKFGLLLDAMLSAHLNITAIKEPDAIILKHFADSLTIAKYIPEGARVADIGCGGGFPSFPLAIVRPDLDVTGFDSTAKKIAYINETSVNLRLTNLKGVSLRVEEGAHETKWREHFDFVTARAVASLPVLSEYCLPYVKVGGIFGALKAKTGADELDASRNAILLLGGKICQSIECTLYADFEKEPLYRNIILVDKVKKTPEKYPRNNSQISKKPL